MKFSICALLCVILCAAALGGCAPRSAPSETASQPSAVSSEDASPSPDAPETSSQPEEAPAPEPEYPLPELSDTDLELLGQDVNFFLNYASTKPMASTAELDTETVLFSCLVSIYQQREINAYFFEEDGNGGFYIPADLVTETAQRLYGIQSFSATENERYDSQKKTYRYNPNHDGMMYISQISEIMGAADDGVAYDVSFYSMELVNDEITPDTKPEQVLRYRFHLLRLNGMPYLQLVDITARP